MKLSPLLTSLLLLALAFNCDAQKPRGPGKDGGQQGSDAGKEGGRPGEGDGTEDRDNDTDGGGKPRPDGNRDGPKGPPKWEDTCRELPKDIQDRFHGLADGSTSMEDLLRMTDRIPERCLRPLQDEVSNQTCTVDEALETICSNGGDREVLRLVMRCLGDSACELLENVLIENITCIDMTNIRFVGGAFVEKRCNISSLPITSVMLLPPEELENMLKDMDTQELVNLMKELAENAYILELLDCPKLEPFTKVLDQQAGLLNEISDEDMAALFPLVPYLPKTMCKELDADKLKALFSSGILATLPFSCAGRDQHTEDIIDSLRQHADRTRENSEDIIDGIKDIILGSGMWGLPEGGSLRRKRDQHGGGSGEEGRRMEERVREHLPQIRTLLVEQRKGGNKDDKDDKDCDFQCGQTIVQILKKNGVDFTDPSIKERLGNLAGCMSGDMITESAQPGQCQGLPPIEVDSRTRRRITNKCKPEDTDVKDYTKDDWLGLGCTITFLQRKDMKDLNRQSFCEAIPELLQHCDTPRPDFNQQLRRLCPQMPKNNSAEYLPVDDLQKMTQDQWKDLGEKAKKGVEERAKKGKGWKAAAAEVIKRAGDLKELAGARTILDHMSMKDVRSKAGGEDWKQKIGLEDEQGEEGAEDEDFPPKIKQFIVNRELEEEKIDIGSIGSAVTEIPTSKLPEIPDRTELDPMKALLRLCQYDDWDDDQSKALMDLATKALGEFNPDEPMKELSKTLVEGLCLLPYDIDQLKEMHLDVAKDVCIKLGASDRLKCLMNERQRNRVANFCKGVLGLNKTGDEDMTDLGELLSDADDVIGSIDPESLRRRARMFTPRFMSCMSPDQRTELRQRVCEAIRGVPQEDIDDDEHTGWWQVLCGQQVADDQLASIQEDLDTELNECCSTNKTGDLDNLIEEVITDLQSAGAGRRKRRAISVETCADLQTLGQTYMASMSPETIQSFNNDEFFNCIPDFGSIQSWNEQQLQVLYTKFTTVTGGDICTTESYQLQDMGSMAYGLSLTHIQCLTNLNKDVFTNLGEMPNFNTKQLSTFVQKYLSLYQVTVSELESIDMALLQHFICGLTPEEIGQLSPIQFSSAVGFVGKLETCNSEALRALASLTKHTAVYGPTSTWENYHYSDIGILLGGLTGSDLQNADEDDIEGWQANGIRHMPPEQFAQISANKLATLSRTQILGVTDDHKSRLNTDQRNRLAEAWAGGNTYDVDYIEEDKDGDGTDDVSGTTKISAHVSWVMTLMLAALYRWF